MDNAKKAVKDWIAAEAAKMTPTEFRLLRWAWIFTAAAIPLHWVLQLVAQWAR